MSNKRFNFLKKYSEKHPEVKISKICFGCYSIGVVCFKSQGYYIIFRDIFCKMFIFDDIFLTNDNIFL